VYCLYKVYGSRPRPVPNQEFSKTSCLVYRREVYRGFTVFSFIVFHYFFAETTTENEAGKDNQGVTSPIKGL